MKNIYQFGLISAAMMLLTVPATSHAATVPAKVTGVQVTESYQNKLDVAWKKAQRATQYQVRVQQKNSDSATIVKTKKLKKTLKNLDADTKYLVRVRGVNNTGNGKWSKQLTTTTDPEPVDSNDLYEQYKVVNGDLSGAWNNTTYDTTGDTTASITVESDGTASFTLDLGGFVFGLLDPDPKTYTSTYDADGIVFTATDDDLFGDLTITVQVQDGQSTTVDFVAQDIPIAGIDTLDATGTIDETSVDLDYTIGFDPVGTATGTFSIEK